MVSLDWFDRDDGVQSWTVLNNFHEILLMFNRNYDRWHKHMKVLLGFQDVLEVVNFGVEELGENQTYVKKVAYKEVKKK